MRGEFVGLPPESATEVADKPSAGGPTLPFDRATVGGLMGGSAPAPTATQVEVTPQWATYLDVKMDVKPYLQFGGATISAEEESVLQLVTDMCCQWVQNYLGRPMGPTQFFRRFSGWSGFNGAYVPLPYSPILKVERVVEWWGVSGPHELKEQTPEEQVGAEAFQVDYLRGYLIRTFQGLVQRPWFPGSKNIEVTWTAGYDPLPADMKIATLELAAHWWRNTQQASRSAPMPQGYDVEAPMSGLWAGVPDRVVRLLSPYTQVGMG